MGLATRKLTRLMCDLSHADASRRRAAAEALSRADERAIYPLIGLLKDDNPGVQDAAMRSIISIGTEATVYMVLPLLRGEPILRNSAVTILTGIGTTAVPLLQGLLSDKDNDVRKFAIDLIADIGDCTCPERLVDILRNDPDTNVRVSAAKAIGALGFRAGVPPLIEALHDEEWVCFAALESLARIGDESAIDSLEALLDSSSDAVRFAAIQTLGAIGSPRARDPLTRHFARAVGMEKAASIKSLGQIGSIPRMPGVSDALIDLFTYGDWEDRLIALRGLVELKEERALIHVIDTAGSLDPSEPDSEEMLMHIKDTLRRFGCTGGFVTMLLEPSLKYRGRIFAIDLAGEMGCDNAVPSLMILLRDRLSNVRQAAIRALGRLEIRDAREAIAAALEDSEGHIRREAAAALAAIGGKESVAPLLSLLRTEPYEDVIEEAVRALLRIDPPSLLSNLTEHRNPVREIIARCIQADAMPDRDAEGWHTASDRPGREA